MGLTTNQTVSTEITFFPPEGTTDRESPRRYLISPPPGEEKTNYKNVQQRVAIENIRGKEDKYVLDQCGFQFYKEPLRYEGFEKDDEGEIEREYYPEVVEFIKREMGASRVLLYHHQIRRHIPGESSHENRDLKKKGPLPIAHADETPNSAVWAVRQYFPEQAEELLKASRFQAINIWRPLFYPAIDHPLALCDYRSVDLEKDLVPITLNWSETMGSSHETYEIKYNPKQEWKYLRGMGTDEVVLMKCFDSLQDGSVSTLIPHAAFCDPTTPFGAPGRQSIEARAFVFYD